MVAPAAKVKALFAGRDGFKVYANQVRTDYFTLHIAIRGLDNPASNFTWFGKKEWEVLCGVYAYLPNLEDARWWDYLPSSQKRSAEYVEAIRADGKYLPDYSLQRYITRKQCQKCKQIYGKLLDTGAQM